MQKAPCKTHPLVVMWSHPRSMSTAIERVMRERGDLKVHHEPLMHYYYRCLQHKEMPNFEYADSHPFELLDVLRMLTKDAEQSAVFAKDMSYYIVDRLHDTPELHQNIKSFFLIRDPRRSIMSFHKLDPGVTDDEIGIKAQWQHCQWLNQQYGEMPLVIEAEQVQRDTVSTMTMVWQYLNLPYVENAFRWQTDDSPDDWQQVAYWHTNVGQSQGIVSGKIETDATLAERFDRYCDNYPHLRQILAAHWPAYESLKELALSAIEKNNEN